MTSLTNEPSVTAAAQPIDSIWESPIKAKRAPRNSDQPTRVARKLLFGEESPLLSDSSNETDQLLKHYPTLQGSQSKGVPGLRDAALLEDLVCNLERTNQALVAPTEQPAIRTLVNDILQAKIPFEEKMSKLGIILFYLDRDGKLPAHGFLLSFRADEMIQEIQTYITAHAGATSNPLVPSGKMHYLMRAFSHMIITSRHYFNPGALYVIRQFLENSSYRIVSYLQPEHREHILVVIHNMLTNSAFQSLFSQETSAHPDVLDLLRFDLKLSPDHPIHSVHIYYACLMAFFSDIRQSESPNCYAICALIYAIETSTFKSFASLVEWIKLGYYAFESGARIPLRPNLDSRISKKSELEITLSRPEAFAVAPFEQLYASLSLSPKEAQESKTASLKELLPSDAAETFYQSYKSSLMVQMMLKILEVTNENLSPSQSQGTSLTHISLKEELLTFLADALKKLCEGKKIGASAFDDIKAHFANCFWLEPRFETDIVDEPGAIRVRGKQVRCRGAEREFRSLFSRSLRLFFLKGSEYSMIESINQFQAIVVEEILALCKAKGQPLEKGTAIASAVTSFAFRKTLCSQLAEWINEREIDGRTLDWLNLFILKTQGGFADAALLNVFGITLHRHILPETSTPYQLLNQLAEFISTSLDVKNIKHAPKILVRNRGVHIWTLSPSCWKVLIENRSSSFHLFLQRNLFDTGRRRLGSYASKDLIDRVIAKAAYSEFAKERMERIFYDRPKMTLAEFRNELLNKKTGQELRLMEELIQEEFNKVVFNQFSLKAVLRELRLDLETNKERALLVKLPKDSSSPHKLAMVLRQALLDERLPIFDPLDIEIAICRSYALPMPFHLGDFNWKDMDREDPSHPSFMLLFDYIQEIPSYYIRRESESKESARSYPHMELWFPPFLLK